MSVLKVGLGGKRGENGSCPVLFRQRYCQIEMMVRRIVVGLLLVVTGCSRQPEPVEVARTHVDSWSSMGMYLPEEEVPFFAANFTSVADVLSDALNHPNDDVRMRAAYVIEELGAVAASLEPEVLAAVKSESSRIVRLYLYQSLRAIGTGNGAAAEVLKTTLDALPESDTHASDQDIYTATDERIYLASALYVLDPDSEEKEKYLTEVIQWLAPPDAALTETEFDAYWEHRWCAVNAVENMRGAREALPLLEAMLAEEPQKLWVSTHVPRAIRSLKEEKDLQQRPESDTANRAP